MSEPKVKPKCSLITLRYTAAPSLKLGGRISQGASAPETGHLADSMPEAGVEEYRLKLSKKCGPAKNPT